MNELKKIGIQNFMGIEIPVIEGGFGENCRVLTINTIAEIHNSRLDKMNELILNNIDEFEDGVDIIDLVQNEKSLNLAKGLGLITNNRQKHCYILSEQGYMLLVGFMRNDKAKEVRKKLRREYFTMRQVINSSEQLKANLLLSIYNGGQDAVLSSKQLTEIEVKEATKPLVAKIEYQKPKVLFADAVSTSDTCILIGELAKIIKQNGVDIGQKRLFEWLRNKGYLIKRKGADWNMPTQKSMDMQLFNIKETVIARPDGSTKVTKTTKVTGKGQQYFINMFLKME